MYRFPVIHHFDDVKDLIDENLHIVKNDGRMIYINYILNNEDTFPLVGKEDERIVAIRREFRGITFDAVTGNILSRKYHKFFNLGERDEPFDFSSPHVVLEKLDGSMIVPVLYRDNLEWHTKMGRTDVAQKAESFVSRFPSYERFSIELIKEGYTPIFEYCAPDNRIVVAYNRPQMVLTAIRNTVTGEYVPYDEMNELARRYGVECVRVHAINGFCDEFLKKAAKEQNIEGYVVRFHDGHMVKVKCEWYVRLHSILTEMTTKKLLHALLSETLDDIKGILPKDVKEKVEAWELAVSRAMTDKAKELVEYVRNAEHEIGNDPQGRKRFALEYASRYTGIERSILFSLYGRNADVPQCFECIRGLVLKNINHLEKTVDLWRYRFEDF